MNLLSEFIPVVPGILCRVTRRTLRFLDRPPPTGGFSLPYGRRTGCSPDSIGVVTFRTDELRLGRMPSLLRGRGVRAGGNARSEPHLTDDHEQGPLVGVFLVLETESGERTAYSSKMQASGLHWATHRAFAEMTIVDQDRKVFVPRGIGGAAPRRGAVSSGAKRDQRRPRPARLLAGWMTRAISTIARRCSGSCLSIIRQFCQFVIDSA